MSGIFQTRVFDKVIYKFSLIFTGIYTILYLSGTVNTGTFISLLLSAITAIGIAGIGYLLNDLKDYHQDLKAKKRNLFIGRNIYSSLMITGFCLISAITPWLYLPFTKLSFYLLLTEIILFFVYAVPPFRLKERGMSGLICDALYAQVVPCFLAVYTFYLSGGKPEIKTSIILVYIIWLFIAGIRNIIFHQIDDYENDIKSSTKTFVTENSSLYFKYKNIGYLFLAEFLLFLFLLYFLGFLFHLVLAFYFMYVIYLLWSRVKDTDKENIYTLINTRVLNEFYEIHLPLLLLVIFTYNKHSFIWLLLFQLILFSGIYAAFLKGFFNKYFG